MDWPGETTDAACDFVTQDDGGPDKGRAGGGSMPAWGSAPEDTPRIEGPGEAPTTIKTGVWKTGGG